MCVFVIKCESIACIRVCTICVSFNNDGVIGEGRDGDGLTMVRRGCVCGLPERDMCLWSRMVVSNVVVRLLHLVLLE